MKLENGKTERLKCKGYYTSKDGGNLGMAINCGNASFKINMRATLASAGSQINGTWKSVSSTSRAKSRVRHGLGLLAQVLGPHHRLDDGLDLRQLANRIDFHRRARFYGREPAVCKIRLTREPNSRHTPLGPAWARCRLCCHPVSETKCQPFEVEPVDDLHALAPLADLGNLCTWPLVGERFVRTSP